MSNLFETVEDRLEDIAELFEGETGRAKEALDKTQRDARRDLKREVRVLVRRTKVEIGEAQRALGDKLMVCAQGDGRGRGSGATVGGAA